MGPGRWPSRLAQRLRGEQYPQDYRNCLMIGQCPQKRRDAARSRQCSGLPQRLGVTIMPQRRNIPKCPTLPPRIKENRSSPLVVPLLQPRPPLLPKERAQQPAAFVKAHVARDFAPVVEARALDNVEEPARAAAFRIGTPEDDPRQPHMHDGSGAQQALSVFLSLADPPLP